MIRIKESTMSKYRLGYVEDTWLKEVLGYPDALGRTGFDMFKEHDITLVSKEEKADVGLAKGISKVKGVPRKRCVLWRGEPPIYDIFHGLNLTNINYLKEHLGVISYYKDDNDWIVHSSGPQNAFSYYNKYFKLNHRNFLCMILRNKEFSTFLNGLILPKTKKHNLTHYRKHMDKEFSDLLGQKYHSYGRGWDKRCFQGSLPVWEDMFFILSKYKFAFVPENSSYPGYVSDKIINAMCCGAVPIYKGAPDVNEYLPRDTFIKSDGYPVKELITKLESMTFSEYQRYRTKIREFVTTEKSDMYSSYRFAEKIANIIEENL
jgi:hypothetical protein